MRLDVCSVTRYTPSMERSSAQKAHPGAYVRKHVIPSGISVKDAAERLGIGRPALSNFLNGKAALSPEMAIRLEKTFGADRKLLLDMQSAFEECEQLTNESGVAVRAYVPGFLTIKARQIEDWADSNIRSRELLPVLLRKLVNSTGDGLCRVDFPGYDNSQRKGPDGIVEAEAATPWVPKGKSYWEFGTNQNPHRKAEEDYNARLKSIAATERSNSTYVCVTPRNWDGKTAWEERKNHAGDWKAVRAFDSSDLEQWLEQSIPAQIWLAEKLRLPTDGYQTLDEAWSRWATASEPLFTPEIFAPSLAAHRSTFKSWLDQPSSKPFVIAADSTGEALAFIACLFDDDELCQVKDRAAVFTSPQVLKTLIDSAVPFIPVVYSQDAERELRDAHRRLHCIVVRPRNKVDSMPDIALDLLGYEDFQKALTAMGVDEGHIDRLSVESGRSPTILRRRLSANAAIKIPEWADNDEAAKALVPMALIGAWRADSKADQEILSILAKKKYEKIEDDIVRLLHFDDSPVWSAGQCRGVTSKIDALFAIARMLTQADLDRFFEYAEFVLSEEDPALELPEKDRWAAAIYDKKRDYSGPLRDGICETLVILSVHGNNLFQDRLGFNIENRVSFLIRNLLTPLTNEKLLSHDGHLPRYAEAAPEEFLSLIEEDLLQDDPVVFDILKPADTHSVWGSPSRTGILWALECLAWKPQSLTRVARILAKLARIKINDNWANKPEASLKAIFRSWMPQTAASVQQRIQTLELLVREFPDVAWEVTLEQIKPGSQTGEYSYRPCWRTDASGAGQVVTRKEMNEFAIKALELMLAWPTHNEKTLGDLIECLQTMPDEDHSNVWTLIDQWAEEASDPAKAELRERIRRYALTRRARLNELGDANLDRAHQVYEALSPPDPVFRHGWLFAGAWVQESVAEIEEEGFDYRKHENRIHKLRCEAMAEVWAKRGFDGVLQLLKSSRSPGVVGQYASTCVAESSQRVRFILDCLSLTGDLRGNAESCVKGFLSFVELEDRAEILQAAAKELSDDEQVHLFISAPFEKSSWRLLEQYGAVIRAAYWKNVFPYWGPHTPSDLNEIVDQLLEAKRPRAAFHTVHMNFKDIETARLKRLLLDVATVDEEPSGHFIPNGYYISEALSALNGRPGISSEEMAQLEFLFIGALDGSDHGIPNLESQIAGSPMQFVQAVALAYKRSDNGDDSLEWQIEDPDKKRSLARAAHRLLRKLKRIPGTDTRARIDVSYLSDWLFKVRDLCKEYARVEIGDQQIGQLLARAPGDEDGLWPCQAVCQVMEDIASTHIAEGFIIGVYNARGVHRRGQGGDQEREIAAKYRAWAEQLHFYYPYVGSVLERIASSYDHDAVQQDTSARVSQRLQH